MGKLAFLFPGQGAQTPGMGRALAETYPEARAVYEEAAASFGGGADALGWSQTQEELNETRLAQPAIYTLSLAVADVLKARGVTPDGVAGFSLGECAALTVSGLVGRADGYALIRHRAARMQDAAEQNAGAMAAVIGFDDAALTALCAPVGDVWPVNWNSPGQTVIAGRAEAVSKAGEACLAHGASRVMPLAVSAAFHSPLMAEAAALFAADIAAIPGGAPVCAVYSNVTGGALPEPFALSAYLQTQMVSPVLWTQVVRRMIDDGYDTFIEAGPGKTLCGLIRRIDRSVQTYAADTPETVEALLEQLALA